MPRPVFAALLLLAAPSVASAQLPGGSSEPAPAGERPRSTRVGLMELLESGGEAFVALFQSDERHTLADPRWDGTASPQEAALTFAEAMDHVALGRTAAWPRALQTLGGTGNEAAKRDAARALRDVFDRLPKLSPGSIPNAEQVADEEIRRWELFPRGIDHAWVYRVVEGGPDGAIVLEKTDDGWRFDAATVEGARTLADSLAGVPPRSRREQRGEVFLQVVQPTFTESPWWAWFALVLGVALGILAAWLASRLLGRFAAKIEAWDDAVTENNYVGEGVLGPLLRSLRTPVGLVLVALGLLFGTAPLHLEPTLSNVRWKLIELLLVFAGVWLLVSLLELAVAAARRLLFGGTDDPYARMAATVIRRVLRFFALGVLAVFVLQNLFEFNVTALLGGLGVLALALSLAAKDAVSNLFGALMIFATRPFLTGDWIKFKGRFGEVADVSLQATKVRLLSGEMWSIPNNMFVDDPVENLSERKYLRRTMNVAITYDTPPEKVKQGLEILEEVLRSDEVVGDGQGDLEEHPPIVNFDRFGDYYLNLRADYWYLMHPDGGTAQRDTDRGYLTWLAHCSVVNRLILERFNDADIGFAFPTRTLYLTDDPARGLEVGGGTSPTGATDPSP